MLKLTWEFMHLLDDVCQAVGLKALAFMTASRDGVEVEGAVLLPPATPPGVFPPPVPQYLPPPMGLSSLPPVGDSSKESFGPSFPVSRTPVKKVDSAPGNWGKPKKGKSRPKKGGWKRSKNTGPKVIVDGSLMLDRMKTLNISWGDLRQQMGDISTSTMRSWIDPKNKNCFCCQNAERLAWILRVSPDELIRGYPTEADRAEHGGCYGGVIEKLPKTW